MTKGAWGGVAWVAFWTIATVLPWVLPQMEGTRLWYGSLGVWLLFCSYFVPATVASFRHHPSAPAIWALNAFAGWTGIGWLASLVWALAAIRR